MAHKVKDLALWLREDRGAGLIPDLEISTCSHCREEGGLNTEKLRSPEKSTQNTYKEKLTEVYHNQIVEKQR